MDVQGHELHVMQGGKQCLLAGVPIVSEFWPHGLQAAGSSGEEYCTFMSQHFNFYYDLSEQICEKHDISQLCQLFERYKEYEFTDLLLQK